MHIPTTISRFTLVAISCFLDIGCSSVDSGLEDESTKRVTLELMTYNIRHGVGMDDVLDLERIAEVIKRENPDLVALQEIDRFCERSGNRDLATELAEICGMKAHFASFMNFQGGEYGLAVLSRLPVKSTTAHPLPSGAEPRTALELRVEVEGLATPISFVCLHHDWTDDKFRRLQVRALLTALGTERRPIILAGDFNALPEDESMDILRKAGWKTLGDEKENTFPADHPVKTIDYFMVKGFRRQSDLTRVLDEKLASDHRPLRTTFRFKQ
ncbi:MAG: endonuclease/exonuclease/phosphatase family metal-dependent hydrolase [Planctomycetota bacterium]|jgi:endonuclease/exonuclease/phosphatase family metal-dependent hydrolase